MSKSKLIQLCIINPQMCKDYDLVQAMDYDYINKKVLDKGRGFLIILVEIRGLKFAIPLRTNMPKNYQLKYKLRDSKKHGYVEGIDFGKVLILEDDAYIKTKNFRMRHVEDYYKIMDNDKYIIQRLTKIISDYNLAVSKNDENKLNDPMRFKFSTLVNYTDRIKEITNDNYRGQKDACRTRKSI